MLNAKKADISEAKIVSRFHPHKKKNMLLGMEDYLVTGNFHTFWGEALLYSCHFFHPRESTGTESPTNKVG